MNIGKIISKLNSRRLANKLAYDLNANGIEPVELVEHRSIALSTVIDWGVLGDWNPMSHTWHHRHCRGWHFKDGRYRSFLIKILEFETLRHEIIIDDWECDLRVINGLSDSKSNLAQFSSLCELAAKNSPEMITNISKEQLQANLLHTGIMVGRKWDAINIKSTADFFVTHSWDNRIFIVNSDGSHHLAAARYIAIRLDENVQLSSRLKIRALNTTAIDLLLDKFSILAINNAPAEQNAFFQCMQKLNVTYIVKEISKYDINCILLPKNQYRSMIAADTMRQLGFLDIGYQLRYVATNQRLAAPNNIYQVKG